MNEPVVYLNADLQPFNTFQVRATAEKLVRIRSTEQLFRMDPKDLTDVRVLGGGSNILFLDRVTSLVIKNEIQYLETVRETPEEIVLEVGAGVNWHELVTRCVESGWGGIENLALIPGTVGAAPIQNIGAYGVELSDVFHSLTAFDLKQRKMHTFDRGQCRFGYRESVFKKEYKDHFVITSVRIRLSKRPHTIHSGYRSLKEWLELNRIEQPEITDIYTGVVRIRQSKLPDPARLGNAGSFFKNPVIPQNHFKTLQQQHREVPFYPAGESHVKLPAGWLIEKSGWKGRRIGQTGTHVNQALVIVNYGGATGGEILEFAEKIRCSVMEKFGIALEREVNIEGAGE